MATLEEKVIWTEDGYDQGSLVLMEEEIVTMNVTKIRKTKINIIVGICIRLLSKRAFKTNFPVFEEAFANDLRKAIWKVLDLHAGSLLHMEKKE